MSLPLVESLRHWHSQLSALRHVTTPLLPSPFLLLSPSTLQILLFSATFNEKVKRFAARVVPHANQVGVPPSSNRLRVSLNVLFNLQSSFYLAQFLYPISFSYSAFLYFLHFFLAPFQL